MRRLLVENKPITAFGTTGVAASPLTRVGKVDGAAVDVLAFEPGALLGRHPTKLWQLFSVVSGTGWALGADGIPESLVPGDTVLWEPHEEHERLGRRDGGSRRADTDPSAAGHRVDPLSGTGNCSSHAAVSVVASRAYRVGTQ